MSWQIEIPIIVRSLISDLGDQPVYSDERLLQLITVAAQYVEFDVTLDNNYIVDISNTSITPDPTTLALRDDIFIGLVSLKAACLADQSTFRTKAALEGIKASLGPTNLTVAGNLAGYRVLLEKGPCQLYSELTTRWNVQNATAIQAILSPFVGNRFDPTSLTYPGDIRRDIYS
jgi:hypothetical protein